MITKETITSILGAGVVIYPCAMGRMGYYTEGADASLYEKLKETLRESGADLLFERRLGETDFALYAKDGKLARVSFVSVRGILRLITTEEEMLFEGFGDLDAKGETELWLMNMDYRLNHDNGLGLVIKLADGSFIVYDGGYPTEVPPLLEYMEANTPKGQKPVIATWFLTHSHGDHYWGFEALLKNEEYLSRVEIRNVMLAIPTKEQWSEGRLPEPFFTTKLPPMLEERGIPLIRPFAGQIIHYPGVDMEILMTVEDLLPVRPWDDNTASSVTFLKFKEQGRSVLVPGDSAAFGLDLLTDMYGAYLKCDVLQNPHHGHSGATKPMFDLCDPEVVLFSTSMPEYLKRIATDTAWNYHLMNRLHVRRAYAADGKYQRIV